MSAARSSYFRQVRLRLLELEPRVLPSATFPLQQNAVEPIYTKLEPSVYRPSSGHILYTVNGQSLVTLGYGLPNQVTYGTGTQIVTGDLGSGRSMTALFTTQTNGQGLWILDLNGDGREDKRVANFGQSGDIPLIGDVDGDGIADLIIYRPSTDQWFVDHDMNGISQQVTQFGTASTGISDIPLVGDFNGDGRLDRAVYQRNTGNWLINYGFNTVNGGGTLDAMVHYGGNPGDIPYAADFNDDKITDLGIFRPTAPGSQFTEMLVNTTRTPDVTSLIQKFGMTGDIPLWGHWDPADTIHTLRPNLAYYNPANAGLYFNYLPESGVAPFARSFGGFAGGQAVAADFNGDTVTDVAVYNPGNGQWQIDTTESGFPSIVTNFGGAPGDIPLAGDVNGDGKADLIIFRTAGNGSATWYTTYNLGSSFGTVSNFGLAGDIPVVGDFNGDGNLDRAVYRPSNGNWYINYSFNPSAQVDAVVHFAAPANSGFVPFAFDFNGDGRTDLGFHDTKGNWYVDPLKVGLQGQESDTPVNTAYYLFSGFGDSNPNDIPLPGNYDLSTSIFVNAAAAGTGAGTFGNPYQTIGSAVQVVQPGQIIRIATGFYRESVNLSNIPNVTFVGASRLSTAVIGSTNNAFILSGDSNTYLQNLHLASSQNSTGSGLVILSSTVFARDIDTISTAQNGVYIASSGSLSLLDAHDSFFNGSLGNSGLFLQDGPATLRLYNTHLDGNQASGLSLIGTGGPVFGTFNMVTGLANRSQGLDVEGTDQPEFIYVANSSFSGNAFGNGAIFKGNVTLTILDSNFDGNGGSVPGKTQNGFNGIEISERGTVTAYIAGTSIANNSGYGFFDVRPSTLTLVGNVMASNYVDVYLDGGAGALTAAITNNQIIVDTNTYEEGVHGNGFALTATITGNFFRGFTNPFAGHAVVNSFTGANLGTESTIDANNSFAADSPPLHVEIH